jgi:preprotein translocase SecE subunit
MNKISKYFRGVNEEARRIRWPDRKTLWKSVAIVLVISIIAALAIALSDWLAVQINRAFRIAFPEKTSDSSSSGVAAAINWFKGVM